MKHRTKFLLLASLVWLLQSCGVITHARYGNGYKLNIGNTWGKGEGKTDYNNTSKKTPAYSADRYRSSGSVELQKKEIVYSENEDLQLVEYCSILPDTIQEHEIIPNENEIVSDVEESEPILNDYKVPYDPDVKTGALLFFTSYFLSPWILIATFANLDTSLGFLLIGLQFLLFVAAIAGLVYAIRGLKNIYRTNGAYRGRGLAISVIVFFVLNIFYWVLLFLLFFIYIGVL